VKKSSEFLYHILNASSSSQGVTKYSISICSNSLVLKIKFPGVISFLKDLPTCAIPKGNFLLEVLATLTKSTNCHCAVSGLKYATEAESSVTQR
jgi:hypothetical protein